MELVKIKDIPSKEDVKEVSLDNVIETFKIAQEMKELCRKERGIGLSAVQVGIPLQLFVIKNENNEFDCYVNCRYENDLSSDIIMSLEGCLSIRSPVGQLRHFQVKRYKKILLNGYVLDKKTTKFINVNDVTISLDQNSIVFAHEIDHQNGVLISDIGEEVFLH
tara:strand:- start:391 stop:882 length:492 start_codon:yes stop_codon:yes gene_type:complete